MNAACPRDDDLSAWMDDELDAVAREGLEVHLASCAACRTRLTDLQALRADFLALPDERLGFELSQVIRGRIEGLPAAAKPPSRRAPSPLRAPSPPHASRPSRQRVRWPRWRGLVPAGVGAAASLSLGLAAGWILTAPVARVAPTAAALQVFAPIAPGGLCAGPRSCLRQVPRGDIPGGRRP